MIDSISIHFPNAFIDECLLEDVMSSDNRSTGKASGLRVTKGVCGTFVKGSLPKLLHGTNFRSLTKEEYGDALAEIYRITRLNPSEGKVMNIELGQTFLVDHPCRLYLSTWGLPVGRYEINRWNNNQTVSFVNRQRSFQGYDKIAEIASKRGIVPVERNKNALRLELRIKRNFKKIMGCQNHLSPVDLLDDMNWQKLVHLWKDFYFKIPKAMQSVLPTQDVLAKELKRVLEMGGVQLYTAEMLFNRIQDCQKAGIIDRNQAYKARDLIRKLEKGTSYQNMSVLTKELDSLVATYQP
jgi:hypothetical protein